MYLLIEKAEFESYPTLDGAVTEKVEITINGNDYIHCYVNDIVTYGSLPIDYTKRTDCNTPLIPDIEL